MSSKQRPLCSQETLIDGADFKALRSGNCFELMGASSRIYGRQRIKREFVPPGVSELNKNVERVLVTFVSTDSKGKAHMLFPNAKIPKCRDSRLDENLAW